MYRQIYIDTNMAGKIHEVTWFSWLKVITNVRRE